MTQHVREGRENHKQTLFENLTGSDTRELNALCSILLERVHLVFSIFPPPKCSFGWSSCLFCGTSRLNVSLDARTERWSRLVCLRMRTSVCSCEIGNEALDSIKKRNFFTGTETVTCSIGNPD
jgi:hypothetical protein